jgi:hypothetical protein
MIGMRGSLMRSGHPRAAGIRVACAVGAALALLLAPLPVVAADETPTRVTNERNASEPSGAIGDDTTANDRVAGSNRTPRQPAPVPTVPEGLPRVADPLANYQGQGICDPTPKKGALAFAQLIRDTYGSLARSIWIPRACNIGGRSEHKEGRAVDWMINQRIPVENQAAEAFIAWLLATDEHGNEFAMARRLGVMYIGWGDRIWESYRRGWSEMHGCFSRPLPSDDNICHRNHIHVSLSWDGAAGLTSFWGGSPTPVPFCTAPRTAPSTQPMSMGRGLDFVATAPRRVLETRDGLGLATGNPCRLTQNSGGGAGAPVVLRIADIRGAPRGDVRAVAVRTTTAGSNSPATLRASTFAGASIAPVRMGGRTESVTVIPVATDGTIAFTTDSGATHLSVDVLGYFIAPPSVTAVGTGLTLTGSEVVYDTADDTVLGPGESRVIGIGTGRAVPTGALLAVTISDAQRPGQLVVRPGGTRRTPATPVLDFRRADTSTQTVLTSLNAKGEIIVVNRSAGTVALQIAVQASSVPTSTSGHLVVPVAPVGIDGARTSLNRVLRAAKGSVGVILQVDATTTGRAATIRYRSGNAAPTTLSIGRKSTQSSLIVVPMSNSVLINREVTGGEVDVTARIVAYLR